MAIATREDVSGGRKWTLTLVTTFVCAWFWLLTALTLAATSQPPNHHHHGSQNIPPNGPGASNPTPACRIIASASSSDPYVCFCELTVSYFYAAPDGVPKRVMGYNGRFPGPTLRCKKGYWMHIIVKNELDEPTSIHWHGLEQHLTPWYDGPEMVAQCPIRPGKSMEYVFELKQSGTYWYHSHHSYQYVDGLWGAIIIDNTPREIWGHAYAPGDELLFLLNDWHYPRAKCLSELWMNRAGLPQPDTGLINGRGVPYGYCLSVGVGGVDVGSTLTCSVVVPPPNLQTVSPCRTYRVRIINTSASTNFDFSIDGHTMDVIEVDGVDTERVGPVDVIPIWIAQRYSVLLRTGCHGGGTEFRVRAVMTTSIPERTVIALIKYKLGSGVGSCCTENVAPLTVFTPTPAGTADSGHWNPGSQGRPAARASSLPTMDEVARKQLTAQKIKTRHSSLRPRPQPDREPRSLSSDPPSPPSPKAEIPHAACLPDPLAPPLPLPDLPLSDSCTGTTISLPPAPVWTVATPPVRLDPALCVPWQGGGGNTFPPAHVDFEFVIDQDIFCDNPITYPGQRAMCMNGRPYRVGSRPTLLQAIEGSPIPNSAIPFYVTLPQSGPARAPVVQLVINNGIEPGKGHPWHQHGHTFWVVGTGAPGAGPYNAVRDGPTLNVSRPCLRRDTTHAFINSWLVVRFIADNPGTWFFHCHINWHLEAGLGAVIVEGKEVIQKLFKVKNLPADWKQVCRDGGVSVG